MPESNGAIPMLGSAAAGLRLELVLDAAAAAKPPEERDEPFAVLNDVGRYSRIFLGRIAMGEDTTVRYLAIKIQRSGYRPLGVGAAAPLVNNVQIDRQWEQERQNLLSLAAGDEEVVRLVDLGRSSRSLPVTYCKKTGKYFHPPCPTCAKPLEDCRDEALLHECGLPGYATSTVRYLYCKACAKRVFYTYSTTPEENPKSGVTIRRRSELYRDAAPLANQPALKQVFPCAGCEYRQTCYPSGAAEKLLTPISYYEFHSLPTELLHLHYDELTDLLGGASWDDVKRLAAFSPARTWLVAQVEPALSSKFQWIYRHDPSGRFAVEALRLKLIAFTQLCRGVRAIHAVCARPHLNVQPANVMVTLMPPGRDVPVFWYFKVRVLDLGSAHCFVPAAGVDGMFLPPHDYNKTFTAPVIRDGSFGLEDVMNVRVLKIEGNRVEAELVSPTVRTSEYCVRDAVRVVPSVPLPDLEGAVLWGKIVDFVERGFRVELQVPVAADKLKDAAFGARVGLYKRYGIPCDVWSLGMMLLRTLLVNDAQDVFAVEDAAARVLNRLAESLKSSGETEPKRITKSLEWLLDAEPAVFGKSAVLYRHGDRAAPTNPIPDRVWTDLLVLAFRLRSNIPGFSFCDSHGDDSPEVPESTLDTILGVLEGINTRLHVDLFSDAQRNRELAEVLDRVMADLAQEAQAKTEPLGPKR